MRRSVDDPIIRHALEEDDLEAVISVVQMLLDAEPETITLTASDGDPIWLPSTLVEAFLDVASLLACRQRASLLAVDEEQEVSPMQAGTILGLSQTVVRGLCLQGALSYRKVGRNRRISMRSIVEYQHKSNIQVAGREQEAEIVKHRATSTAQTLDETRKNYSPGRAHRKKGRSDQFDAQGSTT